MQCYLLIWYLIFNCKNTYKVLNSYIYFSIHTSCLKTVITNGYNMCANNSFHLAWSWANLYFIYNNCHKHIIIIALNSTNCTRETFLNNDHICSYQHMVFSVRWSLSVLGRHFWIKITFVATNIWSLVSGSLCMILYIMLHSEYITLIRIRWAFSCLLYNKDVDM